MTGNRVLVVDDEPKILRLIQDRLAVEGLEVCTASNGEEALRLFEEEKPDLIVLDVMLPKVDGYEVCRRIREKSQVPIIFLSVKGDEVDRLMGLRLGGDDYLSKPFSPSELALRVRAVLRRSEGQPLSPLDPGVRVVGDLSIDYRRREVKIGGREVRLTPKEFDLLWFLAGHPDQVLSRETILAAVWGKDEADPDHVTLGISRLRDKIEENPAHPRHIKTVWGRGYRFEVRP